MQQLRDVVRIWRLDSTLATTPSSPRVEMEEDEEYQLIIDEALQLVYSQYFRAVAALNRDKVAPFTLAELRRGPLGRALHSLAEIARGAVQANREEVRDAIDAVLQLLFWPVGSESYTVPRSFWEQPLGKMLSLAKLRSFESEDLLSISQAAAVLKVVRPTIYRWMDDGLIGWVRDDISGRTFLIRQDVEAMKVEMENAEMRRQESDYPLLVEPGVRALAILQVPEGPVEWGDSEESAQEDREIMAALSSLRRASEDTSE